MVVSYEFFRTERGAVKRKNELLRLVGNFSVRVNRVDGGWEVQYWKDEEV